jgi:predicted transcriptional regulator
MKSLTTQISDDLFQQVERLAGQKNISLNQLVEIALTAQISASEQRDYLQERANRGSLQQFKDILSRVAANEPEEYDRIQSL